MKNERRVKIFEQFKDDISYYGFLNPSYEEREEFLSTFSLRGFDGELITDLEEEEVFSYKESLDDPDDITVITDDAIHKHISGGSYWMIWDDVSRVTSDGETIYFYPTKEKSGYKFPAISVCDENMLEDPEDFEKFIAMLNQLAKVGKQDTNDNTDSGNEDIYEVCLKSVGRKKLEIVKKLNKVFGVGLAKAKELADDAPSIIVEELPRHKAEEIKNELEAIGATIQLNLIRKATPKPKTIPKNNEEDELEAVAEQLQKDLEKSMSNVTENLKGSKHNVSKHDDDQHTDELSSPFDISINDNNITGIFSEGKDKNIAKLDLTVSSRLEKKISDRDRKKKQLDRPSKYGTVEEINALVSSIKADHKSATMSSQSLREVKKTWEKEAYELFVKACNANRRIVLGENGCKISPCGSTEDSQPGVYTTTKPIANDFNLKELPEELVADLQKSTESLASTWKSYQDANKSAWRDADKLVRSKIQASGATIDEILSFSQKFITNSQSEIEKTRTYDNLNNDIDSLDKEIRTLTIEKEKQVDQIAEIDPILAGFALSNGKKVYDSKWLETVKAAAESRKSMPYLPLKYSNKQDGEFGMVFNWKEAVEKGKPNLFIEADTDEGRSGRISMLDNFVATMLLAFPVKQLHFTIIKNCTLTPFINGLPQKTSEVLGINDREKIQIAVKSLQTMFSESNNNETGICIPREIVVFAGFERKDSTFGKLMQELRDIIEEGSRAGIYFAIVLDNDITEYNWDGDDKNQYVKYFTPYSTILTDKKDNEGNPLPDYDLLRREADVPTDDGNKPGSLAELITAYLVKGATTVPNKVYEGIENGALYKATPIKTLDEQPKKDAGKLVIPIAQKDNGAELNLRLDDESYISCFILGRSGMGKSFTLHTILTNLMLKYDPSTTEVILMDFKPGGVEMNYYKDVPHVSSLLVNGADKQVAGEILTSIIKEMDHRGELFQKYDVSSIGRYNSYAAKHGLEQMKHIVMLVDECQDLFKVENPNSDTNIVTDIARKGRSYGIHMILATQTLQKTDIPGDALAQFSDFLFMGCKEDDVMKCEINNRDVQKQVGQLVKGEVIYCHRGAEPVHGYVYNYYGKSGEYREKTHESLLSNRFSHPDKKQFYFNASQSYEFDKDELHALTDAAQSGLKPVPMAVLGKNLSVKADTLYSKFGPTDGANLLVLGANDSLQGERVLWNAALSIYEYNNALGNDVRYFVVPNLPEDVESNAIKSHQSRMTMLKAFANFPNVTLVDEEDRAQIIERVAATVRGRQHLAESDRNSVKILDSIYLIIPNQQLFYTKMSRSPKGLTSLDNNVAPSVQSPVEKQPAKEIESDSLGFEGLVMPGEEQAQESNAPGFMDIDFGGFDASPVTSSTQGYTAKPGRDLDEELRYILEYGPAVKVHVLLQSTAPDKIYAENAMREKEMTLLFNDIVFLKMLQAGTMSLPVDSRVIEQLSSDPKSLRAIAYNGSRGFRTIVPFEIPVINK